MLLYNKFTKLVYWYNINDYKTYRKQKARH